MWFLHTEQLGLLTAWLSLGRQSTGQLMSSRLNTLVNNMEAVFDDLALDVTRVASTIF